MKNLSKRIVSLFLTLCVVISCAMVASAAEVGEKNNVSVPNLSSAEVALPLSLNNGVENLTPIYTGTSSTSKDLTFSFDVTGIGSYLYLVYATDCPISASLYKNNVKASGMRLGSTNGSAQYSKFYLINLPQESYWAPGRYTVKVQFGSSGTSYAIGVIGTQTEI